MMATRKLLYIVTTLAIAASTPVRGQDVAKPIIATYNHAVRELLGNPATPHALESMVTQRRKGRMPLSALQQAELKSAGVGLVTNGFACSKDACSLKVDHLIAVDVSSLTSDRAEFTVTIREQTLDKHQPIMHAFYRYVLTKSGGQWKVTSATLCAVS